MIAGAGGFVQGVLPSVPKRGGCKEGVLFFFSREKKKRQKEKRPEFRATLLYLPFRQEGDPKISGRLKLQRPAFRCILKAYF
jgi:hypothetical protein